MHRACRGFIFLGVFTFLACVAPVHAIVNVSVITKDRKPIKANPSLRCVPINGNARPVSVAMVVDTLDELSCDQSGFDLELSDSSWSIRMTSPFKALYLGVVDGATVVMLETGDCTVQSSVPSEIRSGMVRLGARGTLYGMSVSDSAPPAPRSTRWARVRP